MSSIWAFDEELIQQFYNISIVIGEWSESSLRILTSLDDFSWSLRAAKILMATHASLLISEVR